MDHISQLATYLQTIPDLPGQQQTVRTQLLQVGWSPSDIDQAFARVIVGAPTTPPDRTPQQSDSPVRSRRRKPPLAAQVITGLGIVFILISTLVVAAGMYGAFHGSGGLFAVHSALLLITAAVLGYAVQVFTFWLILKLRAGKRWALIAVSTLVGYETVQTLTSLLAYGGLYSVFSGRFALIEFAAYLALGCCLAVLWTKNRDYFR